MKLSVVIPVYNEKETILQVIQRVCSVDIPKEIIVVDDCSTDGTRDILRDLTPVEGLSIMFQPRNMGKGAALRRGFDHVTGDIVVVHDADLEYDLAEYPNLVQPIVAGKADVVYGSRFLGGPHRVLFFWHRVGNALLTLFDSPFSTSDGSHVNPGFNLTFRGKTAHAGADPWDGRSALEGLEIMDVVVNFLREQVKPTVRDWSDQPVYKGDRFPGDQRPDG